MRKRAAKCDMEFGKSLGFFVGKEYFERRVGQVAFF
jgi:hypothetical protein